MNIYILSLGKEIVNRKTLFILVRPFYNENNGWKNDISIKLKWGVDSEFQYIDDINKADVLFVPKPLNEYSSKEVAEINDLCIKHSIRGYGYISGDYGINLGYYSHLIFFRMGGLKSKLSINNKGFPVMINDYCADQNIEFRTKGQLPVIGFCGHASFSWSKRIFEYLKFCWINLRILFNRNLVKTFEPLFSSAYVRATILKQFEKSNLVKTNFIYRSKYRAGANDVVSRRATTEEYFRNISESDYVLCLRGGGNFSVRFYEALMMGRIPVLIDTDCFLPFEEHINWDEHIVRVQWENRENGDQILYNFHQRMTNDQFIELQSRNRLLWKEQLSINNILKLIKNDF
jgi:hypothetical protein